MMDRSYAAPTSSDKHALLVLQTDDFDLIAHSMRHWDQNIRQMSRGPFRGELAFTQIEGIQLARGRLNQAVSTTGSPPPDTFTFTPVTEHSQRAVDRGRRLRPGQVMCLSPGDEIGFQTTPDYECRSIMIGRETFVTAARTLLGVDWSKRWNGCGLIDGPPTLGVELDAFLENQLRLVESQPEVLLRPEFRKQLADKCVAYLVELLHRAEPTRRVRPSSPERLFLRAQELMRGALQSPLTTQDLCGSLEVSERTLRHAFQEVQGMSPMNFYKAKRLNAVRHDLKHADRGETVHQIAQRWGFWHSGEFASEYRRLFGELPSHTMQRGRSTVVA
jgi:AraC family ethanolamine operon transcriptional activator